jgi:hypothetical protein
MGAIFRRFAAMRVFAAMRGNKIVIRLVASPRQGGFLFVNSPDLPGFSLMLKPEEAESFDAIIGPLKCFILAELGWEAKQERRVNVKAVRRTTPSEMVAELCAA